jgi:fatty acid desaturase
VQDLVDDVLDQVKGGLDDYANIARQDIELFVDKITQRVIRKMVPAILGTVLVSVGLIFSLMGLVTYLSQLLNPALAWALVGLGMAAAGAALVLPLLRRHDSRGARRVSYVNDRN